MSELHVLTWDLVIPPWGTHGHTKGLLYWVAKQARWRWQENRDWVNKSETPTNLKPSPLQLPSGQVLKHKLLWILPRCPEHPEILLASAGGLPIARVSFLSLSFPLLFLKSTWHSGCIRSRDQQLTDRGQPALCFMKGFLCWYRSVLLDIL